MNKLLVILGSTATGKTALALNLAKKFNGELVSCDSRQVYRGLDIGTGKLPGVVPKHKGDPSPPSADQDDNSRLEILRELSNVKRDGYWEVDGIKIWMYDVMDPKKQYSVADYAKEAIGVVRDIRDRGKLPIIVGGTGLYLKALLEGLPNLIIPVDLELRKQLEKFSLNELQEKLQAVSIKRWEKMNQSDRGNPRRFIRAIELSTPSLIRRLPRRHPTPLMTPRSNDTLKIGLTAPRDVLYQIVDDRVVSRINQGMIEEARKLHKYGLSLERMRQLGLEYGILADYLEGKIKNFDDLIKLLQNKIHGFVRRQQTWFKKEKNIVWFDITKEDFVTRVEKKVAKWYHPY